MKEKYTGWAVKLFANDWTGFAGRYYFCYRYGSLIVSMEGHKISLFKSRKLARENKPKYTKSKVVKVFVTISEDK